MTTKITNYIEENSDIKNKDSLAEINYALQAIFNETFKLVFLVLLFLLMGKLNYFLFSISILFSTRIFLGGYHCNTTLQCLLFTAAFFFIVTLLGPSLPKLNIILYYVVALISIALVLFNAPFPNKKRPIKSKKRRLTFNIISTFLTILWAMFLLFYIKDFRYLNCGFLTITLELLQIIPIKKELCYEKIIQAKINNKYVRLISYISSWIY